jgi:hypothetical protein
MIAMTRWFYGSIALGTLVQLLRLHSARAFGTPFHKVVRAWTYRASSPLSDDITTEEETIIRAVPIINTASLNISVTNPFSFPVKSINDAREELHQILVTGATEAFHHYRVEYLTKVLESSYIPIQTIPFMNFALSGDWSLVYSNVLTPRADPTL